jgi:hypothetical protein
MGRNEMKASKLIQDLARQIAEHGDLDVVITIDGEHDDISVTVRSAIKHEELDAIEIYGEE